MEEYADDSFLCFRVLQFPSLQGNSPAPNEYDLVTAYWRKVKKLVKKFGLFSVECGGRTKGIAILDESSYKNLGSPHLYISYKCGMPYVAWFPKKTGLSKSLHRALKAEELEMNPGSVVDHINFTPYDNRMENLRTCTRQQNSSNRRKKQGTHSSNFYGVRFAYKLYRASITIQGKNLHLGSFKREIQAAEAYDKYVSQNDLINPLNFENKRVEYNKSGKIFPLERSLPKSGYRGVSLAHTKSPVYVGVVCVKKKQIYVCKSRNPKKCAKIRDKYIVENGLKSPLNFPDKYPEFEPNRQIVLGYQPIDDKRGYITKSKLGDVIVDFETYEIIKYRPIYIGKQKYVQAALKDGTQVNLNRFVCGLNPNDPLIADHINRNTLDNSSSNLRVVTPAINSRNRSSLKTSTSQYLGVCKKGEGWAYFACRGTFKLYRSCSREDLAARKRDLFLLSIGDEIGLNFDDWNPETISFWNNESEIHRKKRKLERRARVMGLAVEETFFGVDKARNGRWFCSINVPGTKYSIRKNFNNAKACARMREIFIRTTPGINFSREIPNFPDLPARLALWMIAYDYRGWDDEIRTRPELQTA